MIERIESKNHKEWKAKRLKRIGGSDISSIVGMNPWKSNVTLWREKMGITKPDDVGDSEAVQYGVNAEPLIRDLFKLNHKDLRVDYIPDNMWLNDEYPFAHASLDGWLEKPDRAMGVLEIKTGTIRNAVSARSWEDRIPDHYYCQVCWYMMVTGADYAWLTALIRDWRTGGQVLKDYVIERDMQVEKDIEMLAEAGERFWESMQAGKEPALILPQVG